MKSLFASFILIAVMLAPRIAGAADERAYHDVNLEPTLLGVSDTSSEIRNLHTDDNGYIITTGSYSIHSGTIQVNQGAPGTAWLVEGQGWLTLSVSTGTCVTGSNTLVFPVNSSAVGRIFVNEGSDAIRLGATAVLTAAIGVRILGDTSVLLDTNQRYSRGAVYCRSTVAGAQNFSTIEATP